MEGAEKGSAIGGIIGAIVGVIAVIGTSVLIQGLGIVIAGPLAAGIDFCNLIVCTFFKFLPERK